MRINVDLDLVRKYDRPGPRYTSYPTAPHFTENFQPVDWEAHIANNNATGERPLSLYFHVPFCDTLCWFCGCTTLISRQRGPIDEYVDYLFREIDLYAGRLHPDREVVQIHFGGGTPTHLTPDQIRLVGNRLHSTFRISDDAEISIEMDPRGLTRDHLAALSEAGFNRASLGVQDFDPKVQHAVNRVHDEALVSDVLSGIREAGFKSLNLDLIYGLPFQTVSSFEDTLKTILHFVPDRLAVFSYAHVPWMKPHMRLIKETDLPAPEQKLEMLKQIIETLTGSGYEYIGMDHFARENDELTLAQRSGTLQRNFQGYSTRAGADIYAMGMSSISQLPFCYAQHAKELPCYYDAIDDGRLPVVKGIALSEEDALRRDVIMRLMCDMALDFDSLSSRLGIDFQSRFEDELAQMSPFEEDGLLERKATGIEVTQQGRLFIRNIAMTFDAYLEESNARFSRTV